VHIEKLQSTKRKLQQDNNQISSVLEPQISLGNQSGAQLAKLPKSFLEKT